MKLSFSFVGFAGALLLSLGCSPSDGKVFNEGEGGDGGKVGAGGEGGAPGTGGQGGEEVLTGVGGGTGGKDCVAGQNEDKDADGWTIADGDCNDCDPNVNPNAIEVIAEADEDGNTPEPVDEDCDGIVDNVPQPCDMDLAVDDANPLSGARAVELCRVASEVEVGGETKPLWGVLDAKWVMADGSPPPSGATQLANFHRGHGLLSAFGANVQVREGQRMLGVSSGAARQPTDVGYASPGGFTKGYNSGHPQGFPKDSASCPGVVTSGTANDPTGLEITIRAPSNAFGFSFDFNFYTYEWPGYVCSSFNDFFVAILSPVPSGQTDGNISFDIQGSPVSVNNAFVEVCGCNNGPPCYAGGKTFTCPLGTSELVGTGFEGHAATSWLVTKAPVNPGSTITIRWAAYDMTDGILDSTALVDNWRWIAESGTKIGTTPVPK